jgi:hypothetical protein
MAASSYLNLEAARMKKVIQIIPKTNTRDTEARNKAVVRRKVTILEKESEYCHITADELDKDLPPHAQPQTQRVLEHNNVISVGLDDTEPGELNRSVCRLAHCSTRETRGLAYSQLIQKAP